jgi:quercetin dioxygenase-like cupin family protein
VVAAALHRHEHGGGAALFRIDAGGVMPEHDHIVGEHVYVVAGSVQFADIVLEAGDAMWVEPGERHEVRALTDAVFLAVSPPK